MSTNKTNKQLQVIKGEPTEISVTLLPTNKEHVSFSEMFDWVECSWRHKLKYVNKLVTDGPSIHTEYGQVIHDALEEYIMQPVDDRKPIKPEKYEKQFLELLEVVIENQKKKVEESNNDAEEVKALEKILKEREEFVKAIPKIFEQAPKWLDETYPGWEPVYAEFQINEPFEAARFKGFIDAIIKVPTDKKTKTGKDYYYQCIDWKTTDWGWPSSVKKNFNKQLQLVLYKYFYCSIQDLPLDDVKCSFVLLKRTPDKATGSLCEEIPALASEEKVQKAVSLLSNFINQLKQGRAIKSKNQYTCRFCNYKHTEHCI